MRILFLTNKVPYPPKDGGSIATLGMIEAFANAGHETTVLAMNTKKHHITPFEIPEELSSKIIFHLVEVPAKISVYNAFQNLLFSKLPYNAERFIDHNYRKKLALLLKSQKFDIIQLEGLYLYPYISTIRTITKAQIAYRSHNIEHEIWERSLIHSKGIKKKYLKILSTRLKKFEIKAMNTYDLLIPITKRDEKQLKKLGNKKPSLTIPAGFNFDETFEPLSKFQLNLFFIGALDWYPNQEGLIWFIEKCWPFITQELPDTILKIAGRNAPDWLIHKFSHNNIEFLGEIDDANLFMHQNGIMIAPLLSGSGMRVKIIEGMGNYKAIVTTKIGCEGINVKNKEHLFIADTPEKFSMFTLKLLSNRKQTTLMGNNAFTFVKEEFDNQKLNSKLVAFYNQFNQ